MHQIVTATLSRQAQNDFYQKRYEKLSKLSKEVIMSIGIVGNADLKSVMIYNGCTDNAQTDSLSKARRQYGVKVIRKDGRNRYTIVLPKVEPIQPVDSLLFAVLLFVEACRYKQMEQFIPHFTLHVWDTLRKTSLENLKNVKNGSSTQLK